MKDLQVALRVRAGRIEKRRCVCTADIDRMIDLLLALRVYVDQVRGKIVYTVARKGRVKKGMCAECADGPYTCELMKRNAEVDRGKYRNRSRIRTTSSKQ